MKHQFLIVILSILLCMGCGNRNLETTIIGDWVFMSDDRDKSSLIFSFIDSEVAYINPGYGKHLNYRLSDEILSLYQILNDSTHIELVYRVKSISGRSLALELIDSENIDSMTLHPSARGGLSHASLSFSKIPKQNRIVYDNIAFYHNSDAWHISDYFVEISGSNVFLLNENALAIPNGYYQSRLSEEQVQTISRLVAQIKRSDLSFKPGDMQLLDVAWSGVYINRNQTMIQSTTYVISLLPSELQVLYRHLNNLHRFLELEPTNTLSFDTPNYEYYKELSNFPPPPDIPF